MNITENLPDLIKLQPLFKRVLGDFKAGDRVYKHSTIFGEEIDSKIWPEDKRSEIVIIREQSSIKSYWHCTNEKGEERILTDQDMLDVTCYRIPTLEELWEMVDHLRYIAKRYNPNTGAFVDCEVSINNTEFYTAADPYTCLLKALLQQEGL